MIISTIIKINGVYDILCSISILNILPNSLLTNIHKDIFKYDKQENIDNCYKLFETLLAFFILLYGLIRIFGNKLTISITYIIEGLYFYNEMQINNTVYTDKASFVIISSTILSILVFVTQL